MRFSVVISVYKNDNLQYFKAALDSIMNQTVPPSEIIIVVDGPVPIELNNFLAEYKSGHGFIKPIYLEKNSGLGNALRIGVEASSFELIARMDSDDISFPGRFEKQLRCFEEDDNLSLLGGNISEFIGGEDNVIGIRAVPADDKGIRNNLKKRCPFNHMTVMFKKSEVLKAGNYKDWFWNEDYYLWIRMYEAGCRFGNLPEILVNVRVGADMYKRRGGVKYFRSEAALQKYMLDKKIIGFCRFIYNVGIRFIVQILMPNSVRGYMFKKFAREKQSGLIAHSKTNNQGREKKFVC